MLAGLFGKKKRAAAAPAPKPIAPPMTLESDLLSFVPGFTTRRAIERRMGPAIQYPAPGWKTWAAAGTRNQRWVLSAIYRGQVLIGIEHYIAKTDLLPRDTPPANGVFVVQPGDIALGNRIAGLPEYFISAAGKDGSARSMVYQHAFQARWQHGIAIISGNDGRIERIALYANHEMPTLPEPPPEPQDPGDRLV
ncbi:MAG TPA: hypothetical protein VGP41_07510 [Candidatus Lustribacter sp.]|jgi:hypothetical protein|nr:hypothetical protein [Candidatus Lustribacter sp.]